jgi:hypothetical protein
MTTPETARAISTIALTKHYGGGDWDAAAR